MKKLNLILIMLSLALFSCETSNVEDTNEDIQLAKMENVKKLKGEEQKIAFRLLSNETKVKLWENKFENLLKTSKLSKQQILMVTEIKSVLSVDIYDRLSSNNDNLTYKISEWSERAQKDFTKPEFVNYFGTINSKVDGSGSGGVGGGFGDSNDPSCDCSYMSNHCGAFWESIDCIEGKDDCVNRATFGCGTLLAYDCDGVCNE